LTGCVPFEAYLKVYNSVEGIRTEWLAGEIAIYTMTNNTQHQDILQFLTVLLNFYLSAKSLGKLLLAGVPMYLGDERPAREPDLLIVVNEHLERIKGTYLDGIADVVVEIVSPESDERDHGIKFIEYEAAGVPEYWLIDPLRAEATIYCLGTDKRYHRTAHDGQGRLMSVLLPSFALDPALLWQETLLTGAALLTLVEQMK